jgi:hypothetical protein
MLLATRPMPGNLLLRGTIGLIALVGLCWGIGNVVRGTTDEDFREIEAHLLRYESYRPAAAAEALESPAAREASPCEAHIQRALLLLEIPLADAALHAGLTEEFDRRTESLEQRARRLLSCVPRDSLAWLVEFGLAVQHGVIDEHSFELLATSYDTSPHEAYIAVRRIPLAIPVIGSAPGPIRQRILTEFRNLVRDGFLDIPAQAYLKAPEKIRTQLQTEIGQLDARSQRRFSDTLQSLQKS